MSCLMSSCCISNKMALLLLPELQPSLQTSQACSRCYLLHFPVPVSGFPQPIPPILTPGRKRRAVGETDRYNSLATESGKNRGSDWDREPASWAKPTTQRVDTQMHTRVCTLDDICSLIVLVKKRNKDGKELCWKKHQQWFVDSLPRSEWRTEHGWLLSARSRAGSVLGIRQPCGRMLWISN